MLLSSIPFLYFYLPIAFTLYFTFPVKYRNAVLLLLSLFFYFYGEPVYVLLLLFSTLSDYTISIFINRYRGTVKAKYALLCSITVNMLLLGFFKYADFFILNINTLFGLSIPLLYIPLPLGISFYTFQTMSYTIDIYKKEAEAQKNPIDFAVFVTMFPQLTAGPIVRYNTIADQLKSRVHSYDNIACGIKRFVIGLWKKVIIANTLGELNEICVNTQNQSVLFFWLTIISFMLQIYFDFSGYSDMAIGLGRVFGFHFLENFNYPFIAKSITDFWRRWHISMGTWFREYIYIPLGGNRVSRLKWIRNIAIVWFCTGLWHGAAWNFIIWGIYFGIFLTIEKLYLQNKLSKISKVFQHIYTLFIVTMSFVIFHMESLPEVINHFKGMFGFLDVPILNKETLYYLKSYAVTLIIALIGSTPFLKGFANTLEKKYPAVSNGILGAIFYISILLLVTAFLVDSSFNPFLYFRF